MRYLLILLCLILPMSIIAQDVDDLLGNLTLPLAADRQDAVEDLIDYDGLGLSWRLRKRWDAKIYCEQLGLLEVATGRKDPELLSRALDWISDDIKEFYAWEYILKLKQQDLLDLEDDRIPEVMTFRAVYLFAQKAMHYRFQYNDSTPTMYEDLKEVDSIYKAIGNVLRADRSIIPPIRKARRYIEPPHPSHDEYNDELIADLTYTIDILQHKALPKNESIHDHNKGAQLVRSLQFAAAKVISYSGQKTRIPYLKTLILYYDGSHPKAIMTMWVRESAFRNALRVAVHLLGDPEPLADSIKQMLSSLELEKRVADSLNEPVDKWTITAYKWRDLAQLEMDAEMYKKADDHFTNAIKSAINYGIIHKKKIGKRGTEHIRRKLYYQRARARSMSLKFTGAIKDLNAALKLRYFDWRWLIKDSEMNPLMQTKAFDEWIRKYGTPEAVDTYKTKMGLTEEEEDY